MSSNTISAYIAALSFERNDLEYVFIPQIHLSAHFDGGIVLKWTLPIISFPQIKDKRPSTPLSISEKGGATTESRICVLVNF